MNTTTQRRSTSTLPANVPFGPLPTAGGVTARQIHDDIEGALGHTSARRGRTLTGMFENAAKSSGLRAWHGLKRHPFVTVTAVGAATVAVASVVGVGELFVGMSIAIAAYKVLREGEPPLQAIEELENQSP